MEFKKDDKVYNRFFNDKCLLYGDKMEALSMGDIPFPITWHIYPTNRCTHNCSFCIMAKERHNQEQLSRQTLLKAVWAAISTNARAIHFSGGGEPLLHPNINEAIAEAKKGGLTTVISTNGSLLNNDVKADHIRVSLNAGTKATHARVMQAETWDTVLENIKAYPDKQRIGLGFVITPDNWFEVYQFIKLAAELEVNFVHIRPAYMPDKDQYLQEILPAVKAMTDKAEMHFKNLNIYSIKDKFDGYWSERKYSKCRATPLNAVLKATGRFIPCQDRLDVEFGDLNKQEFVGIWGSDEHKQALDSIDLPTCPRCVMNRCNELIENVYINDNVLAGLL